MSDIIEGEVLESKIVDTYIDDFSEKLEALKDIGVDPNNVNIIQSDDGISKLYSDPNYLKMMLNKHANVKTNKGPIYTQKSLEKRTQERRIKNKRAAKARRK